MISFNTLFRHKSKYEKLIPENIPNDIYDNALKGSIIKRISLLSQFILIKNRCGLILTCGQNLLKYVKSTQERSSDQSEYGSVLE